ncbi:MAG TPA: PA14 domain-containing protein [Tepidisphaeraceae bacterium]|nr:PA14 domain-containing protein [Tepidisphaeraceae bacterium]
MYSRLIDWLFLAVLLAAGSATALGATVRTRAGQTYTGKITVGNGQFSIATDDGQTIAVAAADVAAIDFRDTSSAGASTRPTTAPAQADDAAAIGSGLRGEYFDDSKFTDPKFYRGDPRIEFNFAPPNEPFPRKDPAQRPEMSIRWTGRIRPRFSERYTFYIKDYTVERVWIDHRLVIDNFQDHGEVTLQAGQLYDLRVDWIIRGEDAVLEWESPSQPREIVPGDCLFPPREESAMPPNVIVTAPNDGTALAGPVDMPMSVHVLPGSSTPTRVAYRDGEMLVGIAKTPPFDLVWQNAPIGDHRIIATVTDADGTQGTSDARHVIIASDAQQTLPKPWVSCQVPAPGIDEPIAEQLRRPSRPAPRRLPRPPKHPSAAPSAAASPPTSPPPLTFHDGTLALTATGGDVYAQSDAFQYVFQRLLGDGSIIARIANLSSDQKGSRPLAGVMIRSSVTGPSAYVGLLTEPTVGDVFIYRSNPGDDATNTSSTDEGPIYLKLTRKGYAVRAYRSTDGQKWEFMGGTSLDMPQSMLVGVITCGGDPSVTATATFDHLAVTVATHDNDTQKFQPAVVLTDGTRLVGSISHYEKDTATLIPPAGSAGPVTAIPTAAIARVLFLPLPPDALASLTPGQTGVFLNTGDFYEGQIDNLANDRLNVNSVIFGPRDFGVPDLSAIILRPAAKPTGIEVDLTDGSTIQSPTMSPTPTGLQLHCAAGTIKVALKDVNQIIAH